MQLPWCAGDSTTNPAPDQSPAAQTRHDERSTLMPSILVVDDEPGICSMVEEMLTDEGYRVRTATSGAAALALCAQEIPRLLLCDQMMPGMTGEELCRQLRMDPRYATMRMILMSAASETSIRASHQVDAFLKKPFHIDRLVLLIGDVLHTDPRS
jgi:CheY-like chemotaxis protein